MLTHGSALPKQPDIVICDLDGPGSFTLIDIKVTDSCGPTAVSRLHSDTTRHASHSHISRQSSLDYWGSPQGTPPPGVRMRLVTFVISAAGAISPDAQGLSRLSLLWSLTSLFSLPPLFLVRLSAHPVCPSGCDL